MQVMDAHTKFAHLGKPGTAFSKGFGRRLAKVMEAVDLKDKQILDVGCGEGVWLGEFAKLTAPAKVFGTEYDHEQIPLLHHNYPDIPPQNISQAPAEQLPFTSNYFDIVFSHEVLEHVQDDKLAVQEAIRVLKPGGKFIIFTPNRGWPFEQHGIFLFGKYFWGNIPLLPWLPKWFHYKFAPHVKNYSDNDIRNLFTGLPVKILQHTHVFPGFDGWKRRFGPLGSLVQKFFWELETTPLHSLGISHFAVVEKLPK